MYVLFAPPTPSLVIPTYAFSFPSTHTTTHAHTHTQKTLKHAWHHPCLLLPPLIHTTDMDKRLDVHLNADRHIIGTLRGYDQFMNLVLDECEEVVSASHSNAIGIVVVRGNSVVDFSCLDPL